jgi:hypothetical protein
VTRAAWIAARWWAVLTVVLVVGYLAIGVASPLSSIRWPSLAGALLVGGALWLATRSQTIALVVLVVGAAVPAITAWWSLMVPVTGVLVLLCGYLAIRATATRTARRGRSAATSAPATGPRPKPR